MIANDEIADILSLSSKLMTLHNEDENKAKLYASMAYNLDKYPDTLAEMDEAQLLKVRGVGNSLAKVIQEIVARGTSTELEQLISKTPDGVFEMFKVKGLGASKIKSLWQEIGIDNLNDLEIACESGKIAELKGFGAKTQVSILESLVFLKQQSGKLRMDQAEQLALELNAVLSNIYADVSLVGELPRSMETIEKISFLVVADFTDKVKLTEQFKEDYKQSSPFIWRGYFDENRILIEIHYVEPKEKVKKSLLLNGSLAHFQKQVEGKKFIHYIKEQYLESEEEYYTGFGLPYVMPEMREGLEEFEWHNQHQNSDLVSFQDLKGCLHNHSKYSDGKNTMLEMAEACQKLGLEYFGIADHSQSATYANGLIAGRVVQQQKEIDELNLKLSPFTILKGIESDILGNGDLDYENDILKTFDYVVASVHSNISMSLDKANERLIKAIENPFTTILGHPTARLLLARTGYPIDHKKIIDACAANGVIMELNASPYRLDLDWRYIPYCMEKGVMISINPDAHHIDGLLDMKYGVAVSRKAGLLKSMTFNALSLEEMRKKLKKA